MTFQKKRALFGIFILILILAAAVSIKLDLATQLRIGAGWKAQILCSGIFVSGRDAAVVLKEDVSVHPLLKFIGARADFEKKEVRTSFLGLIKNRAIYHPRLGSILLSGVPEEKVRSWPAEIPEAEPDHPETIPWPTGDLVPDAGLPAGLDSQRLDRAVEEAFSDPDPKNPRRTRAVLIVHEGRIIAERYAPGITLVDDQEHDFGAGRHTRRRRKIVAAGARAGPGVEGTKRSARQDHSGTTPLDVERAELLGDLC
jgi:hypothetical protein